MVKVFVGDDRVRITEAIDKIAEKMGVMPERVKVETLRVGDLPSIFSGASLFAEQRLVVIKDCSENAAVWGALENFLDAAAQNERTLVVLFEKKLDKRTSVYKALKARAEIVEMELDKADEKLVFKVFGLAVSGETEAAMEIIKKIKHQNEPQMFFGLLVSQVANLAALSFSDKPSAEVAKELGTHPFVVKQLEKYRKDFSKAEMRALIEKFVKTDKAMKLSSPQNVWLLIEQLILQIAWR
jgi:DNA polymerase III delta subunit